MKQALLKIHIAIFLAGFTAVLGKLISLNEAVLVLYRLLFTVVCLSVLLTVKKTITLPSKKELLKLFGVGAVITFHWVTFYGSVKYANVSVALVCLSAAGFFSALIEPILNKKKIQIIELALGAIAVVGIYIIFDFYPQYTKGIIYGILAALGAAIFPIFNKELLKKHSAQNMMLYELLGGFVILLCIVPLYITNITWSYFWVSWQDAGWMAILVILCTVIAFNLQLQALQKISAFTSNLLYNLEPIYGIVFAFLFFNENKALSARFYIGVSLIAFTILCQTYLVVSKNRKKSDLSTKEP
jgi:drug/metabolite transporter (DMT)-like permease